MVKKFYVTKKHGASSSASATAASASSSSSAKLSPLDKAKDAFIQILADLSAQSDNQHLALSTFDGFVTSTLNELLGRNEEEDDDDDFYSGTTSSMSRSNTDVSETSDTLSNSSGLSSPGLHSGNPRKARKMLKAIAADLRLKLPLNAESPQEKIIYPTKGEFANSSPSNTIHVDTFLYDDDEVDRLVDTGKLSRSYCTKCGSHDTKELIFISHSMSHSQLKFVFRDVLPPLDENTLFVDVGSRLGAVLFAGYLYAPAPRFVGIEINPYFCSLQEEIVKRYSMGDRISIVCSDVQAQGDVLMKADVVMLNNVFQFFTSEQEQAKIWSFLRASIRKRGALIVSVPSLEESVRQAGLDPRAILNGWVDEVELAYPTGDDGEPDEESDALAIHMYSVA